MGNAVMKQKDSDIELNTNKKAQNAYEELNRKGCAEYAEINTDQHLQNADTRLGTRTKRTWLICFLAISISFGLSIALHFVFPLFKGEGGSTKVVCDKGWEQHESTCYFFSNSTANWYNAKKLCKDRFEGKLAEPDTQLKILYLKSQAIYNQEAYWLGGSYLVSEGQFIWASDGRKIKQFDWGNTTKWGQEPNNSKDGTEHCIQILDGIFEYRWNDNSCTENYRYICEKVFKEC